MNNKFGIKFITIVCFLFLLSISLSTVQANDSKKAFSVARKDTKSPTHLNATGDGTTVRVSITPDGIQGNDDSQFPSISSNGRFVAFTSRANNLVSGDSNGVEDVYVVDTQTGSIERVSIASDGTQANSWSESPSLSEDGRYVAFSSNADNLVANDSNNYSDIFVHDRQTGQTRRVSIASNGDEAEGDSYSADISANGNFVAFSSMAENLAAGDDNWERDIFVHTIGTGQTEIVSIASDGTHSNGYSYSPSISADGTKITFGSYANNLVAGDSGYADIFVHDRSTGDTIRVSVSSDGTQSNNESFSPAISADGRYVAFESSASNLVAADENSSRDIFRHDTQSGITILISKDSAGIQGNDWSASPAISADGELITFSSRADNLITGDTNNAWDAFIHDRLTGETARISVSSDGRQGIGESGSPWDPNPISSNGRFIAFESSASNLVICGEPDTNNHRDILLRDLAGELSLISGTVTSTNNNPLPNVIVSSNGHTAQTDTDGNYQFSDMCPRAYSLSASLLGFKFSPATRQFTLPPDAVNQDFTGQPLSYAFLPAITRVHCGKAFYEDFDEPNTRWPILENSNSLFNFVNGEYLIVAKNPNGIVAASPNYTAENFEVGVQVRNPGGKEGIYGIVFNLAGDWSHFYTFEVDADGYFGIWRYNNTRGWKLLLVNYSDFLNKGTAANNLKVRRDGDLIEFYANGHLLGSIEDSTYLGKQYLGLIVSAFDQPNVDIRFDNFYVTPSECAVTNTLSSPISNGLNPGEPRILFQEATKKMHD